MLQPQSALPPFAARARSRYRLNPELLTKPSPGLKLVFEKVGPIVNDLADVLGTQSSEGAQVLTQWRQQECDVRNAVVGIRKVNSHSCNAKPKAKRIGPQDQAEIPFVAFLLKTAPTDVPVAGQKCQCTRPSRAQHCSLLAMNFFATSASQFIEGRGMCSATRGSDMCAAISVGSTSCNRANAMSPCNLVSLGEADCC